MIPLIKLPPVCDSTATPADSLPVGANGETITREVLDIVAEPVEIRWRVQQREELSVLQASRRSIRRLP